MIQIKPNFLTKIICPNCEIEYSVEEIFLKKELYKKNPKEIFQCEQCDKNFEIEAKVTYRTSLLEENTEETIVKFNKEDKNKIILNDIHK